MRLRGEDGFWIRVAVTERCWPWLGYRERGYGRVSFGGVLRRAHQVAYELCFGPIPKGLCVLHTCDNPACVRPDHLFLGTQLDNIADRTRKGRSATGRRLAYSPHPTQRKLTADRVRAIRAAATGGEAHAAIAQREKVARATVYKIVERITWRELA